MDFSAGISNTNILAMGEENILYFGLCVVLISSQPMLAGYTLHSDLISVQTLTC